MASNVTYLFGAGASANQIPVVSATWEEMNKLLETMRAEDLMGCGAYRDLQWFYGMQEEGSPDSIAKRLYDDSKEEEYQRAKQAVSFFYMWYSLSKPVDPRFEGFIRDVVAQEGGQLPSNVQILTWNYDLSWERAARGDQNLHLDSILFQCDIFSPSDFLIDPINGPRNKCPIFKLNGDVWYRNAAASEKSVKSLALPKKWESLEDHCKVYEELVKDPGIQVGIYYAWDERQFTDQVQYAIERSELTDILVVIGYSFPPENAQVDKKIVDGMANLKKVVIVDVQEKQNKVRDALNALIINDLSTSVKYEFAESTERFWTLPSGTYTYPLAM